MTEDQWLACADPSVVFENVAGRVSARKVRLALCGCLRTSTIWSLLTAPASRRAVEVGEAFADGATDTEQLAEARRKANTVARRGWRDRPPCTPAAYLANHVCLQDRNLLAFLYLPSGYLKQLQPPAELIRDVLGNPFRTSTSPSGCLVPSIAPLAQAAYDERLLPSGELDSARLAILADALEEAGCTDDNILNHLRCPRPHVRGCWALDLILGKT